MALAQALETHLQARSYIGGTRPSKLDAECWQAAVGSGVADVARPWEPGKHPALKRWCVHMDFLAEEMPFWPAQGQLPAELQSLVASAPKAAPPKAAPAPPKAAPAPQKAAQPKASPKKAAAKSPKAPAPAAASDAAMEALKAEIAAKKAALKAAGKSGGECNKDAEVQAMVARLQAMKSGEAPAKPSPAAAPSDAAMEA